MSLRRGLPLLRRLSGAPASGAAPATGPAGGALLQHYSGAAPDGAAASTSEPHIASEWFMRQRQRVTLGNRMPIVTPSSFVAPSAVIAGDVDLLDRVSVWHGAVLRGDLNNITVGAMSNIQDRTVVHAARTSPTGLTAATLIGKYVTIEPGCVLRSVRVQDTCVVGARSVLLEGSMMEEGSVLAPGSVLPPARRVPAGEMWGGNPARFIRALSKDEKAAIKEVAESVAAVAYGAWADELPHGTAWREVEAWRAKRIAAGELTWGNLRAARYFTRREAEEAARLEQAR